MKQLLIAVIFGLCMIGQAMADTEVSHHTDTRNYSTFGVVTSHGFPRGLSFWGFTDIHAAQDEGSDLSYYFMEYRVNQSIPVKGLALEAEYNDHPGDDNNLVRLGLTYTIKLPNKGWTQFRAHPWDTTKNNDMQVSNAFGLPLSDRWSLSGWIDYNLTEHGKNQWIYEPAVNYQLTDDLIASVEYRFNGFDEFISGWIRNGIAFGIIWKL